jgi:hypothetical protein
MKEANESYLVSLLDVGLDTLQSLGEPSTMSAPFGGNDLVEPASKLEREVKQDYG